MERKPIKADICEMPMHLRPFLENANVYDSSCSRGARVIFIDKDGGVDLNACELFHNAILEPIDEFDPTFGQAYRLNVSSLGIDRPFKTDKDFNSHIGKKVEVKLKESIRGKKFYDGVLVSYDGKQIALKVDEKNTFTIDLKNTVKVNEYIDFE